MDFDLKPPLIKSAVADSLEYSKLVIINKFQAIQDIYRLSFENIENEFILRFYRKLDAGDKDIVLETYKDKPVIRIFLAELRPDIPALKVRFSNQTDQMSIDDRLVLPIDTSLAGRAHSENVLCLMCKDEMQNQLFSDRKDRYRKPLKWPDAKWCLCIPIHDDPRENANKSERVLIVESDRDLAEFDLPEDKNRGDWNLLLSHISMVFSKAAYEEVTVDPDYT